MSAGSAHRSATLRTLRAGRGSDALIEDLPVGVQQRVEILKALANDAKYLIFDEPTAVLTPQEIDQLIAVMRSLARRGEGESSSSPTNCVRCGPSPTRSPVIRRGKVVGTAKPDRFESDLAELMVGRAVQLVVDKKPASPAAEPRLVLDGVSVASPNGTLAGTGSRPRGRRR